MPTSVKIGEVTFDGFVQFGAAGSVTFVHRGSFANPFPAVGQTVAVELFGEPDFPTLPFSFDFTPDGRIPQAVGFNTVLDENFLIDGEKIEIIRCFTHGNGHQIRFANNDMAQAFIAADVTVNTGIAGQQTYKSSVMDNVARINAAQYRAFPGRYAANTEYTVTISE